MLGVYDADSAVFAVAYGTQKPVSEEQAQFERQVEKLSDGSLVSVVHENTVLNQTDKFIWDAVEAAGCDSYECHLTDSTKSFRKLIDPTYKAQRTTPRPFYYDLIRSYIMDSHNGLMSNYLEADDTVSIRMTEEGENAVCIRIDKDLDMVVGNHFNPRKGEFFQVTHNQANLAFWMSTLVGDTIDNIKGMWKWGPKKSFELLSNLDYEARKEAVRKLYADDERLVKNGHLLWLLRYPDDAFSLDWDGIR